MQYVNLNTELSIVSITRKKIILKDGLNWEVFPFRNSRPELWKENDRVTIFSGSKKSVVNYQMKNINENEIARAYFIG